VRAGLRPLYDVDASQWDADIKWSVDALRQALE